jgi:uncharacterized protein with PhoU and TrkA domain
LCLTVRRVPGNLIYQLEVETSDTVAQMRAKVGAITKVPAEDVLIKKGHQELQEGLLEDNGITVTNTSVLTMRVMCHECAVLLTARNVAHSGFDSDDMCSLCRSCMRGRRRRIQGQSLMELTIRRIPGKCTLTLDVVASHTVAQVKAMIEADTKVPAEDVLIKRGNLTLWDGLLLGNVIPVTNNPVLFMRVMCHECKIELVMRNVAKDELDSDAGYFLCQSCTRQRRIQGQYSMVLTISRVPGNCTFTLNVRASDTVAQVKAKIEADTKVPAEDVLIKKGRGELVDGLLVDNGITVWNNPVLSMRVLCHECSIGLYARNMAKGSLEGDAMHYSCRPCKRRRR